MKYEMARNAPKGLYHLAQGGALGLKVGEVIEPCKGSTFKLLRKMMLPLQGVVLLAALPQGAALG